MGVPDLMCYTRIPGQPKGKRIGIVKWYETGYYPTDFDHGNLPDEDIDKVVDELNTRMGIPTEVAESASNGSMFGWHVLAAQAATDFYRELVAKQAKEG